MKRADKMPPLGYPGGPCHVIRRIDDEIRNPGLREKLIDNIEEGSGLSNPEAAKVYGIELERGPWKFKKLVITAHAQYRMDLRGITVPEIRASLGNFFKRFHDLKSRGKAHKLEQQIARGQRLEWRDNKLKIFLVFSTNGRDTITVITVYEPGVKDPPAPGEGVCPVRTASDKELVQRVVQAARARRLSVNVDSGELKQWLPTVEIWGKNKLPKRRMDGIIKRAAKKAGLEEYFEKGAYELEVAALDRKYQLWYTITYPQTTNIWDLFKNRKAIDTMEDTYIDEILRLFSPFKTESTITPNSNYTALSVSTTVGLPYHQVLTVNVSLDPNKLP